MGGVARIPLINITKPFQIFESESLVFQANTETEVFTVFGWYVFGVQMNDTELTVSRCQRKPRELYETGGSFQKTVGFLRGGVTGEP